MQKARRMATLQHYDLEPAIFELFLDPYEIHLRTLPFRNESLAEAD